MVDISLKFSDELIGKFDGKFRTKPTHDTTALGYRDRTPSVCGPLSDSFGHFQVLGEGL